MSGETVDQIRDLAREAVGDTVTATDARLALAEMAASSRGGAR